MPSTIASLPQDRRRAIFRALVEAQDRGVPVTQSRLQVAIAYGVRPSTVDKVEQEGIDKEWPPLSDAVPAPGGQIESIGDAAVVSDGPPSPKELSAA